MLLRTAPGSTGDGLPTRPGRWRRHRCGAGRGVRPRDAGAPLRTSLPDDFVRLALLYLDDLGAPLAGPGVPRVRRGPVVAWRSSCQSRGEPAREEQDPGDPELTGGIRLSDFLSARATPWPGAAPAPQGVYHMLRCLNSRAAPQV